MTGDRRAPHYPTKVCPRCGARLYADMAVCYGCLYDFTRDRTGTPAALREGAAGDGSATMSLTARPSRAACEEVGVLLRTPSVDVWVAVGLDGASVGRGEDNDVVLHSRAVSRRHLRLVPTPDGMEASDLGATNPTRYQGRDLTGTAIVPYGDTLDVCGCALTVTGPAPGAARSQLDLPEL